MTDHKYKVIVADPPWDYANWTKKCQGSASAQYATIGKEAIAKIPVADWADKDSTLLLWTTWPKLLEAHLVMGAWGFNYITGCPWVKTSPGTGEIYCGIGFWWQSASEVLLAGRKGKAPAPKRGDPVRALMCGSERQFYAPTRAHSAKPTTLYDWVEAKFSGPYLELFARNKIHGWTCWGHETGYELHPGGVREVETAA